MTKFNLTRLDNTKRMLRKALPHIERHHMLQAIARGLGWANYNGMKRQLELNSPVDVIPDDFAFINYLRDIGQPGVSMSLLTETLAHLSRGDQ